MCTHGGYLTLLSIDFLFNTVHFKKRNLFIVAVVGTAYGVWNFMIVMYTGKPIYDIMDWRSTASYIFILGATSGMLLMFMLGWMIDMTLK